MCNLDWNIHINQNYHINTRLRIYSICFGMSLIIELHSMFYLNFLFDLSYLIIAYIFLFSKNLFNNLSFVFHFYFSLRSNLFSIIFLLHFIFNFNLINIIFILFTSSFIILSFTYSYHCYSLFKILKYWCF